MPHTVNGIGTWYYGKKNVCEHPAVCEFCHKDGILKSYDTTLYFVLAFIPILPLKKMRVLYECPFCQRHRAMSMKEWLRNKQKDIEDAIDELNEHPDDPQKAEDAVAVIARYQDYDEFKPAAEVILQNFQTDSKVLLMLGCAFASFNKFEEAERIVKKSLRLQDEEDTREILADVLIKQGKADEAAKYLKHIIDQKLADKSGCLVQLAQAYQALGDHDNALKVLDQSASIEPALGQHKEFKRLKKLSQKNLQSGKKIKSQIIPAFSGKPTGGEVDIGGMVSKIVGPIIISIIVIIYFIVCVKTGNNQTMYLVNGLNKSYTFKLNGQSFKLKPFGKREIHHPEGTIEITSTDLGIKKQTGHFSTSFFLRPFLDRAFIINPDKTAILLKSKVFYTTSPEDAREPIYSYIAGQPFYTLKGIDYPFDDFPETIEMEQGSVISRTGLYLDSSNFAGPDGVYYWNMLEKEISKEKAIALATHMLKLQPTAKSCLKFLFTALKPEAFVKAVKPTLNAVPVNITSHRYYTEAMNKLGKHTELQKEYSKRVAEKPQYSEYKYLLARVTTDRKQARKLLKEAANVKNPSAYSFHGLAYADMVTGNFQDACKYWQKAVELEPKNTSFETHYERALLAAGEYDKLLKKIQHHLKKNKFDFVSILQEMHILIHQGKQKQAKKQLDKRFDIMIKAKKTSQGFDELKQAYHGMWQYCCGKMQDFTKTAQKAKSPTTNFNLAITEKSLSKAEKAYKKLGQPMLNQTLAMYILAMICKDKKATETYQKAAVKLLKSTGRHDKNLMADYLSGSRTPVFNEIKLAKIDVDTKPELAVALGLQYPAIKNKCFKLANKLNYSLFFPHYFLKNAMED